MSIIEPYSKCYSCNCPLVPKHYANEEQKIKGLYSSEEHIIPNVLGGKLKSSELLCKKCNNEFNKSFEMKFNNEFILHKLFKFRQDRGNQKPKAIEATNRENKEIVKIYGNEWRPIRPYCKFTEEGELIDFTGTRKDLAQHINSRIKQGLPVKLDIDELFNNSGLTKKLPLIDVDFTGSFGSISTYKTITKIAVNYYLQQGGDKDLISDTIKSISRENNSHCSCFYYPKIGTDIIHEIRDNEISHLLYLKGTSRWGLLYCYIELFNTANFIIVLNKSYSGPDIEQSYCFNLLLNKEVSKKVNLQLFRNPIDTYDNKYIEEHIQPSFSKHLGKFYDKLNLFTKNIQR